MTGLMCRGVEQPLLIVALPDHRSTDAMTKAVYIKTHSRSLYFEVQAPVTNKYTVEPHFLCN